MNSYETVLFSESETYRKMFSPTPEQMTLMNQFFLVNQKHRSRPILFDFKTNDSKVFTKRIGSVTGCR